MFYEAVKLALQAILRNALEIFPHDAWHRDRRRRSHRHGDDRQRHHGQGGRRTWQGSGAICCSVRPGQFGPGRASCRGQVASTSATWKRCRRSFAALRAIAPTSQKVATVVYGSENRSTPVTGTENGYFFTHEWLLTAGRRVPRG